ncbi:MAG: hypothetical protein Q8909_07290 [Bacteroidota bacterium]|nr:hypothetical protein [Bacteroidota bacterium]
MSPTCPPHVETWPASSLYRTQIQSVGIEFVQNVNDTYTLLRGSSAMKIADVY